MKPIIRWIGGKTQLLPEILKRVPNEFNVYHEPFVGSAAVYFALAPTNAVLSDENGELVNFYDTVRNQPSDVAALFKTFKNDKETYLNIRSWDRQTSFKYDPVMRAVRFLYLNKTSFQGMWRVNASNQYNTPYGRPRSIRLVPGTLEEFAKVTESVEFRNDSFEPSFERMLTNDFAYIDPPYVGAYTLYTSGGFSITDHERLRDCCVAASERGVKLLISNSDCEWVRSAYSVFTIEQVSVKRNVAAKSSARGKTTELLMRNY
jgi:DNA adenine methylase